MKLGGVVFEFSYGFATEIARKSEQSRVFRSISQVAAEPAAGLAAALDAALDAELATAKLDA